MELIETSKGLNPDDKLFVLVYGDSGTGKTHFVGTLGELGYTLVIDIDKGYKTLVAGKGFTQQMKDNLVVVTFDKFTDLNQAYQLIDKNDPAEWSKFLGISITRPFDWIAWDTWSELQWHMLQALRKKEKLLSGNLGKDLEWRPNFQIQHWGAMTDMNKFAVEELRNCNINQLFTMQEKSSTDEKSGITTAGPAIHGKMTKEMPTYFDVVMRTTTGPAGDFCLTTKRKGYWPAKTRLGEGKDYTNPTAKQVLFL